MVLTVTLNPAVDKTYKTQELIVGNVNRMRRVIALSGGKGINVTRVLRQYDVPVCATGFLGGCAGDYIENDMKNRGVECHFVRVDGETRTDINIVADNGYVTEVLEPGPEVSQEKYEEFLALYDNLLSSCELVVLSGSAPIGVPNNVYAVLIEKAQSRGIKTILDTSGEYLRYGIEAKPYMIKPNIKELEYIVRRKLTNRELVIEAARAVHKKGVPHVIVSMGKKGLLSVDSAERVCFARAGHVGVVNTVGSGDCVVASYVMSILRNDTKEEAARCATAISASSITTFNCAEVPLSLARDMHAIVSIERLK